MSTMHVLIATTGALSPEPVVEFTRHLIGSNGHVSVTTVIEVPRDFLETIDSPSWHPLEQDTEEAINEADALVARYVEERGHKLTEPVLLALQAAGIESRVLYLQGTDPATSISQAARQLEADIVILGATRPIFDQAAWESVSARVMIECGKPVLVVPPADKESDEDSE